MDWIDFRKENVLKASDVLDDAFSAIWRWSFGPIGQGIESRIVYIAAVSMLRAVGHVLKKVDCETYPEIKDEVNHRYLRWKKGNGRDVIFPHFIEKERNLILKEYAPTWNEENRVDLYFSATDSSIFSHDVVMSPLQQRVDSELVGKKIEAVIVPSGPLAGYEFGELLDKSARWWGNELTEIERLIQKK